LYFSKGFVDVLNLIHLLRILEDEDHPITR